jgi:predicted phosphoribosyltransferase
MFQDRGEAGRLLAAALTSYEADESVVVLAIPRGAVVMGAEVARSLAAPLDLVIVAKIGAPGNPEFAAGAIDQDGNIMRNPAAGVSMEYLREAGEAARREIDRRLDAYRGGRRELDVTGKTAILVDDGVATGFTALKAIDFVRRRGADRVVLAVPVIAREAAAMLEAEADELVALERPRVFLAVGGFYRDFRQVSDAEVEAILAEMHDSTS